MATLTPMSRREPSLLSFSLPSPGSLISTLSFSGLSLTTLPLCLCPTSLAGT